MADTTDMVPLHAAGFYGHLEVNWEIIEVIKLLIHILIGYLPEGGEGVSAHARPGHPRGGPHGGHAAPPGGHDGPRQDLRGARQEGPQDPGAGAIFSDVMRSSSMA